MYYCSWYIKDIWLVLFWLVCLLNIRCSFCFDNSTQTLILRTTYFWLLVLWLYEYTIQPWPIIMFSLLATTEQKHDSSQPVQWNRIRGYFWPWGKWNSLLCWDWLLREGSHISVIESFFEKNDWMSPKWKKATKQREKEFSQCSDSRFGLPRRSLYLTLYS